MTEYEVGREVEEPEEPAAAGEPVEEYADPYADPQEWISGLIAKLERAEQGIGSGPRDALMARIKLAQAYSELGDTVQAAPLAVTNVAQAMALFPSSDGMLRQLREFRDAACEAAGWTAAMMREPEAEELAREEPSELVARPDAPADAADAGAAADPAEEFDGEDEGEDGGRRRRRTASRRARERRHVRGFRFGSRADPGLARERRSRPELRLAPRPDSGQTRQGRPGRGLRVRPRDADAASAH